MRTADIEIIALLLVSLLGIIGCGHEDIAEKLAKELPKITLERFSLTETEDGKKLWILDAQHARVYNEVIIADSVRIRFYDEQEVEYSVLHAPGGVLNTKTHNILVGDSVVVFTSDSSTLFTDSLFWYNDSQRIMTNQYVKIVKRDSTVIEGNGLRADPRLDKIEIIGTTKGISPIELPSIQ